jgi:hypothetical protein
MDLLCDFHMHSQFSDGKLSLPDLIDFYGTRGFDCIAVTDHLCQRKNLLGKAALYLNRTLTEESFPAYMESLREQKERAWKKYQMIVLPGFEITKNSFQNHRSSHFLAIGIESFVSPDIPVIDALQQIRSLGGLCVAAHPISNRKTSLGSQYLWDRREELVEYFDAWEITDNQKILPMVAQSKLPKLASTDFHHPRQIESWKTILHCDKNPEAIFDAIRKQRLSFRLYRENKSSHLAA